LLYRNLKLKILTVAALAIACAPGLLAQEATGQNPTSPPASASGDLPTAVAAEQTGPAVPQVLTVVHRLSGLKVLRLMRRAGAQVAELDKDFVSTPESHTSITAGFVLGDGHTVVARLQQGEMEADESATAPVGSTVATGTTTTAAAPAPESTDLMVVGRNGQRFAARYIGLDGWTGLSLLEVEGLTLPSMRDASEEQLRTGQRVRLFAPEPASRAEGTASGTLYLRVGEIDGQVADITRSASGRIVRLTVRASSLTQATVGGLAFNEAGEVLGIVESSTTGEAFITPSAAARSAAARVLARRGSVPRPWLGVRGRQLSSATVAQLVSAGWNRSRATALLNKGHGILLTRVAPGAPASSAGLRAGDVIARANEREIIGSQDFSLMLDEAGKGAAVRLTVLRPNETAPRAVVVKLDETPANPALTELAQSRAGHVQSADPFIARGAETIPLSEKAAANLGAQGGRLVVFVQPESAASRSGLRAGDLIEAVGGRSLSETGTRLSTMLNGATQLTLGVVREGRKININLQP
jgi:serine protease Do